MVFFQEKSIVPPHFTFPQRHHGFNLINKKTAIALSLKRDRILGSWV
jgi:hypothetical protein